MLKELLPLNLTSGIQLPPMCEINYKWENNFFLIVEFVARHLRLEYNWQMMEFPNIFSHDVKHSW
jgi:hypothetical protein